MDEDHVEDGDIAQRVLEPELIEAESSRSCESEGCGGQQSEERTRQQPEIGNVKEGLLFAYHHKAAEDYRPAANADWEVLHGTGMEPRGSHQSPIVGHIGDNEGESEDIADRFLVLISLQRFPFPKDEQDYPDHQQDGRKVGESKDGKLLGFAFPEEVEEKVFDGVHTVVSLMVDKNSVADSVEFVKVKRNEQR